ncbi:adenosine deaminase [Glaciecola sp. MH2013]|uniref:adenosine deaminase n=1 Tax=Glaciecola sp. MH2013 TaxID=2785524 RepID=UPI00189F16D9|nr:adenosine deaminase [Glaciecola sp. MH2013]MBF7073390.1 adenosine deaminase [Glaciecola sp. MH2013]
MLNLIQRLPKAELHLHIEGTLEPDLMWRLAQKHNIELPFDSVEAIRRAYQFDSLQSFLDLYYQGANVLLDEDDFYELMWAYLLVCKKQNIVHTEIMFDPQTHTERGIPFSVFMSGFDRAIAKAEQELGVSVYLIMSFLRHLSEEAAIDTLFAAAPYYSMIKAVGLDSSERGNPPAKFERVFAQSSALGFKLVAHAGEEGPPNYIWQAIKHLNVDRIDHGVRSAEDSELMLYLQEHQMPLTVCPLSNLKLRVIDKMEEHNILDLLSRGINVMVNSDDPSYFGGYLNENYAALVHSLSLSKEQLIELVFNSIRASFLPNEMKGKWLDEIQRIAQEA